MHYVLLRLKLVRGAIRSRIGGFAHRVHNVGQREDAENCALPHSSALDAFCCELMGGISQLYQQAFQHFECCACTIRETPEHIFGAAALLALGGHAFIQLKLADWWCCSGCFQV